MHMNEHELSEEQKAYAAFVYILHQIYNHPYHDEVLIRKVMDRIHGSGKISSLPLQK